WTRPTGLRASGRHWSRAIAWRRAYAWSLSSSGRSDSAAALHLPAALLTIRSRSLASCCAPRAYPRGYGAFLREQTLPPAWSAPFLRVRPGGRAQWFFSRASLDSPAFAMGTLFTTATGTTVLE